MVKVFKYKDNDVVIWAVHPNSFGDGYNEPTINVRFVRLHSNGILGELKSVVIFESDYGRQFKPTDKEIEIRWSEQ